MPVLQDGDLTLFESGAILLHLGARCPSLLPSHPAERARTTMWMFAALNSMEPHLASLAELDLFYAGEAWTVERRPALEAMALKRLQDMEAALEGRDWLAASFSAADILMTTVLRLLDDGDLVARFARVSDYKARCMARPAFRKALAAQLALYEQRTICESGHDGANAQA